MTTKNKFPRKSVSLCVQYFLFAVCLTLFLFACDKSTSTPGAQGPAAVEIATIRVTPTRATIPVGESLQFTAALGDAAGNIIPGRNATPALAEDSAEQPIAVIGDRMGRTGRIVRWSSNQPTKVQIEPNGLVTALKAGVTEITATSEGKNQTVKVIIEEPSNYPITVVPSSIVLSAGETLPLKVKLRDGHDYLKSEQIIWESGQPEVVAVSQSGLLKAISAGTTSITATFKGQTSTATVQITPSMKIHGLDFPGNAGVNSTMRFEFTSPLAAYPATYIWHAYPRQQQSYYTTFFWGNNGAFYPKNTYYGFHPYPDWKTTHQHFWEIATAPGGDFISPVHVVYDRWYIQVAVCSQSDGKTIHEFYWDWPDITKVVRHNGKLFDNPPEPRLIIGDAPWNPGNEVWDGVLRGLQFYDVALTQDEISQEIASPGSVHNPWYLNLNPTPLDISDKSNNKHNPAWVGTEKASPWTGTLIGGTVIKTAIAP